MCLPQLLLLVFMVCSDQVSAISWLHNPYTWDIALSEKQPSSYSSPLLMKAGMKSKITHYATYTSNTFHESVLTGGMATFNIWILQNKKDQISASAIWVSNTEGDDDSTTNTAVAGLEVNPSRYGDSKTHFFMEWTADGYKSTGCINLECDGFVPVNYAPITPGDTIEATGGKTKVTIKIFKNKADGDWWLHFGYDNRNLTRVGYWPKSIFKSLADHANYIIWGGFTASYAGDASPAMGNGHWPGEKSAYVRDIKYVNTDGQGDWEPAPGPNGLRAYISHEKCYGLSPYRNDMFYYGGPGGCTK
ncbi:hypothetical protein CFC21_008006 [Triticum aestivum]|uniref:Neprosin PEP catalytic domain-containing protein n=3 Tax=Triticum TaxID=4564 RepID=A0A9R0VAX3_TRITD|nr:uncharacterized protein LOC123095009 [Triticum aestivum]KAF6990857.1 hypothetical protein CFC21_008006 [Triticum aestivum]VAH20690.1 unnamed protein product [Triticum turgidum subsp. durum]